MMCLGLPVSNANIPAVIPIIFCRLITSFPFDEAAIKEEVIFKSFAPITTVGKVDAIHRRNAF